MSRGEAFRSLFVIAPGETDALNGLRALSILAIFFLHIYGPAGGYLNMPIAGFDTLARNLTSGLDLFFVLSGYLVYGRLIAKVGPLTSNAGAASATASDRSTTLSVLRQHLRGRFLRIVPAYYVALLGSLWFLLDLRARNAGSQEVSAVHLVERIDLLISYSWSDLLFVSNYFPDRLLEPGWSLGVEMQYYLLLVILVPVLVRLSRRSRLAMLSILYAIPLMFRLYYASFDSGPMQYFYTHTRIDSIVAGMIASELASGPIFERLRPRRVRLIVGGIAFLLLVAGHLAPIDGPFYRTLRYSLFNSSFAAILLLSLSAGTWLARSLSNAPLRYVARISYSMYLWHPILAMIAVRNSPFHFPLGMFLWNLSAGLLLTMAGSTILYLFVEQPFHRLARGEKVR